MNTKLSSFADFKAITKRFAIGAFLGLAWGHRCVPGWSCSH
jgi:hypothetical protein